MQIYAKDINFWAIPSCQLQYMCDKMSYPPRYILKVFPASKTSSGKATSLRVEFPGAVYTLFKDDSIILTVQLDSFSFRTESCKFNEATVAINIIIIASSISWYL